MDHMVLYVLEMEACVTVHVMRNFNFCRTSNAEKMLLLVVSCKIVNCVGLFIHSLALIGLIFYFIFSL